jgi:ABC-2 type transport system ATP-binding protein
MRLARPEQLAAAQAAVAALPQVAGVEVDAGDARLTALPRDGAPLLGALAELTAAQGIALNELHLETGRLDEVFRTITT